LSVRNDSVSERTRLRRLAGGESLRPYRVVIHGLPHFSRKLASLLQCDGWEVRYHACQTLGDAAALANDLRRADLAYTWGGRVSLGKFLASARLLGVRNLVMLWSGSDIFFAQEQCAAGKLNPWIAKKTHWAVSPWIAEEARALGLPCEFVQASFVQPVAEIAALPQTFSVLSYVPNLEKSALYGWNEIQEVARALPEVKFNVVGVQNGSALEPPPNVHVSGWAQDLAPYLKQSSVLWRPVRHDGLSFMVLEALSQGRHVLYSYPFSGCIETTTVAAAILEIKRLFALHRSGMLSINQTGVDRIAAEFTPEIVRGNLLRRWEEIILRGQTSRSQKVRQSSVPDAAQEAPR
jgi:hypothetical protein